MTLEWTANPRVQKVNSQLDNLPTFRQASLQHIGDTAGEIYHLITGNYSVFPMRSHIYEIQTGFRKEEFVEVIHHLADIWKSTTGTA